MVVLVRADDLADLRVPPGNRLEPLSGDQTDFAKAPELRTRLSEIINGKRGVSTDTALRFPKALGTTSDVWLNIERMTDLCEAMHSPKAEEIAHRADRARAG